MNFFIYMIRAFIVAYPFACYAMHDIEMVRDRRDIIAETCKNLDKESSDFSRIITSEKWEEINKRFVSLIDHFHYDIELKYHYTQFLHQTLRGHENGSSIFAQINFFAQMVLSDTPKYCSEFMGYLANLVIHGKPLRKHVEEICLYIKGEEKRTPQTAIEHATLLLPFLGSLPGMPIIYDATLHILVSYLYQEGHQKIVSNLVAQLWNNKDKRTPYLKALYAERFLMPRGKFEKAVEFYESILKSDVDPSNLCALDPNNPYQTSLNYNHLAFAYLGMAQVKLKESDEDIMEFTYSDEGRDKINKGVISLDTALCLSDDFRPGDYQNLAFFQMLLGDYESAIKNIQKIGNKPTKEVTARYININNFHRIYELILQKSGRTEELTSILLEKQRKIIDKHKKRVALIKEDQVQRQQEAEACRQKRQDPQQQPTHRPIKQVISGSSYMTESVTLSEIEKGEAASSKKQKRKARKALPQSAPVALVAGPPVETKKEQPLNYIESRTESRSVKKTFDKLFSKYLTGQDEKISLNEVSCFFKALGQDLDPSKGKGSHKKATLNFQNQGIEMEEQTLILTNTTYLKPEQIKEIQLAFVRAGIVPNNPEIIEKLREYGELN